MQARYHKPTCTISRVARSLGWPIAWLRPARVPRHPATFSCITSPTGACCVMRGLPSLCFHFPPQFAPSSSALLVPRCCHAICRCPFPIPDWSFCFSSEDKSAIQSMLMEHHPVSAYWGSLNGHIHMWDNGTAFDNWPTFRQWETSGP